MNKSEKSRSPWKTTSWLRNVAEKWQNRWEDCPSDIWIPWLVPIMVSWLSACGVLLLSIWVMQTPISAGFRSLEPSLLEAIVATRPIDPASTNWLNIPGHPLYLILIIGVVVFTAMRLGRVIDAISIVTAFLLATATVGLGWQLWSRERPDVLLNGAFAPGLNSFPSGHTAQSVTVYGLLAYFWIRNASRRSEQVFAAVLMSIVVATVAMGRLWIAAHWPSDVLVSLLIGAIIVAGFIWAIGRTVGKLPLSK